MGKSWNGKGMMRDCGRVLGSRNGMIVGAILERRWGEKNGGG
jgi:hypothetical protein